MQKKKSLVQQTADELYRLIVDENEFEPGEQLPNENDLSLKLNISRTTLREAVRILALQGIVTVLRGKGTFVSNEIPSANAPNLEVIKRANHRLRDLLEARIIFEPEIARIVCLRATDSEIEEIISLGEENERIIRLGLDNTEMDQKFHKSIIQASHNEFFLQLLPVISSGIQGAITEGTQNQPYTGQLLSNTLKDHALIMEFLKKRDSQGAKNAMYIHLRHIVNDIDLKTDEPII